MKSLRILFCILVLVLTGGFAHANTVTISNRTDVGGSLINYNPLTTTAAGTTITIGIAAAGYTASSVALNTAAFANDTMAMTVTAANGFHITGVQYFESGTGMTGTGGFATASGGMVADGTPGNFPVHTFLPSMGGIWSIGTLVVPVANKSEIQLSVSNNLFAFLFGAGPATISKTAARFEVTLAPIPLPPAVWLFGSALVGLVSIGARRQYSA